MNASDTTFLVDQTLAALVIHDGGVATVGAPAQAPAPAFDGFGTASLPDAGASAQAVPEPGSPPAASPPCPACGADMGKIG